MERSQRWRAGSVLALLLTLSGCGGGGVASTPTPTPAATPTPSPTPTPTPTPAAVFDTAEYRRSNGVVYHGAITAYQQGASGAGVTVGVIDSGLSDPTGEFTGRISAASKNFVTSGSYNDVSGHGTAVTATIAAARNNSHIMGVAWGATVMALRTDDQTDCNADGCTHPTSAIAAAIDHAWQNGARVINISLGGGPAPANLLQAVSRATAAGTIIVVSAGNNPSGQGPLVAPDEMAQSIANPLYSHGLVIIAPSVNADDTVSSFSAGVQGFESVSLAALGNRVLTIDHTGTEYLYSGTSFSAPQISGAAALLAQAFPNLTGKQIVDLLLSSARDVGAPGADVRYGVGILDIAAAFAPRGALSLAGTQIAVTPATPSLLSSAMGDATPAAISSVALDSLDRAYRVDLTPSFAARSVPRQLASALDVTQRHVATGTPGLAVSLNIAPGLHASSMVGDTALPQQDEDRPRLLSGTLRARLSPASAITLGLRTGYAALERQQDEHPAPTFLVAPHGFDAPAGDQRAIAALALRQQIANGLTLTGGFETGDMLSATDRTAPGRAPFAKAAPYQAVSFSLGLDRRVFGLTAGVTLLDERASALGARFDPLLGAQSARTLFARLGAQLEPVAGWTISTHWQRGWTDAASGGVLADGGTLVSQSWAGQISGTNLLADGDLFGLRVAQPLRVVASRFNLALPDQWDWESSTATTSLTPLNLTPRGRQRDYELSYGRSIGPGWLGANLFLREQPGNIATMPDDLGMALRWSMGF
ncbi:MAG: S8 family serine peptidase [Sphingomonas sp.]|nr:S8 family serine peptidase [Sphingomonas sp.]